MKTVYRYIGSTGAVPLIVCLIWGQILKEASASSLHLNKKSPESESARTDGNQIELTHVCVPRSEPNIELNDQVFSEEKVNVCSSQRVPPSKSNTQEILDAASDSIPQPKLTISSIAPLISGQKADVSIAQPEPTIDPNNLAISKDVVDLSIVQPEHRIAPSHKIKEDYPFTSVVQSESPFNTLNQKVIADDAITLDQPTPTTFANADHQPNSLTTTTEATDPVLHFQATDLTQVDPVAREEPKLTKTGSTLSKQLQLLAPRLIVPNPSDPTDALWNHLLATTIPTMSGPEKVEELDTTAIANPEPLPLQQETRPDTPDPIDALEEYLLTSRVPNTKLGLYNNDTVSEKTIASDTNKSTPTETAVITNANPQLDPSPITLNATELLRSQVAAETPVDPVTEKESKQTKTRSTLLKQLQLLGPQLLVPNPSDPTDALWNYLLETTVLGRGEDLDATAATVAEPLPLPQVGIPDPIDALVDHLLASSASNAQSKLYTNTDHPHQPDSHPISPKFPKPKLDPQATASELAISAPNPDEDAIETQSALRLPQHLQPFSRQASDLAPVHRMGIKTLSQHSTSPDPARDLTQQRSITDQLPSIPSPEKETVDHQQSTPPSEAETAPGEEVIVPKEEESTSGTKTIDYNPSVFPVGLVIGPSNQAETLLIRGQEDGEKAINFDQWLVPFNTLIQILNFDVKTLESGELELRAPGLATRVDPNTIKLDPELGQVWSISDLKTLFDLQVDFDLIEYAIRLDADWLSVTDRNLGDRSKPIVQLEGLPWFYPPSLGLTALEQTIDISGTSQSDQTNAFGDLIIVGNLLDTSWFANLQQSDFLQPGSWGIQELQILRQTDPADYVLGSQTPFWPNQGLGGELFGFTTIQRFGFTPPEIRAGGAPNTQDRLSTSQLRRTIAGRAEPGTLVQLRRGLGRQVLDEVLVDSSGIFRFDRVVVDNAQRLGNFRLFLFPNGQLSASPEIREATFTSVVGQLPAGATALVFSAGVGRSFGQFGGNEPLGNFEGFRGGIAGRWGISEDLTLGVGGVYDEGPRALGEFFFQPGSIPFEASVSVLTGQPGSPLQVVSDVLAEPTDTLRLQFNSDQFSSRLSADWRILPQLTLLSEWDSETSAEFGAQLNISKPNFTLFARTTLDTETRPDWSVFSRYQQLELSGFGNESGSTTELNYFFSRRRGTMSGHALFASYDQQSDGGDLGTVGWFYRSPQRTFDGLYLWEFSFGLGVGSNSIGPVASLQTAIIPGLLIRATYEGISVNSGDSNFNIELVSSLNFQSGVRPGNRRVENFRTGGGVLIQAFFDANQNGKRDHGEKLYVDPNLVLLNNEPVGTIRSEITNKQFKLRLPPGNYRVDIDPAGLPLDWRPATDSYAAKVVAGVFTPVLVPLLPTYTVSGIVADSGGQPRAGVLVEAIGTTSGRRITSLTNGAGVFFLENLDQETYTLNVDGRSPQPARIKITPETQSFIELNLVLSD